MAKKINSSDLFGSDLFSKVNKDAGELLKNIDAILLATRQNLAATKEYSLSWKAVNSQSIKDLNATIEQSSNLIKTNTVLSIEKLKIEQQLQKTIAEENKTKMTANRLSEQESRLANKATKERAALTNQYKIESKLLNDLRDKYKNLAAQGRENGTVAKGLLQDITKLDNKLKTIDKTTGQSQRNVGNYGSALQGLGRTILGVTGLTLGVGQIASGIQQSTEDYKNFSKALQEVEAITGLTGKELDYFKQKALDAGKAGKVGASDFLEAVKLGGSARPELLKNSKALNKFVEDSIVLSKASGDTLPNSIGALSTTLNAFNLPASKAAMVMDSLAAGSQQGTQEIPYLTEAFTKFGGIAASAGESVGEMTAAVEVLGIKIPDAATAGLQLKNILIILQKEAAAQKRPFEGLRKELDRYAGKVKDVGYLTKVFKGENLLGIQTLIEQRNEFDRLTKAVNKHGTALVQANAQRKSAAELDAEQKRKLEAVRIELGEKLVPIQLAYNKALVATFTPLSDLIPVYKELNYILSVNEKAVRDSALAWINGQQTYEEANESVHRLGYAYKELDNSTEATQIEGAKLIKMLQDGSISIQQFGLEADKLMNKEKQARLNAIGAAGIKPGKIAITTTSNLPLTEEELAKIKAARDKQYQEDLKMIEKQRTLEETAVERSVSNEKQKTKQLEDINIDFLAKKLVLDYEYNKEFEKTDLERIRAIGARRKKEEDERRVLLEKQIEIQNKLDQAEIDDTEDQRIKDEKILIKEFEDKTALLNANIPKENELIIAYKKQLVKDLKKIDDQYALDQEELEAEQYANSQIYEQNVIDKKAEQRKKDIQDLNNLFSKTIDAVEKQIQKENELRENAIDQRLSMTQKEIDRQSDLATRGKANQLAFEKSQLAKEQLEKKQLQQQEIKQQKLIAFWRAYAQYVQNDPKTAISNTLRDVAVATVATTLFAAEGAEDIKGPGTETSDSIPAFLSRGESVLTAAGTKENPGLATAVNEGKVSEYFEKELLPSYIIHSAKPDASENLINTLKKSLDKVESELKNVKRSIENKEVFRGNFTKMGDYIEERIYQGLKQVTIYKTKKKRLC